MDVYLDLSLILEVCILFGSLYFTYNLSGKRCKKRYIPFLIMFNCVIVYLYQINFIVLSLIRLVIIFLFFFLEEGKKLFVNTLLYIISDTLYRVIVSFFIKETVFYNGLVLISDFKGMWSYLLVIFLTVCFYISTKFVDYVYRLSSFKTECFIEYLNHKVYASAYFDTGNTLKYLDVPVVFTSFVNFPYKSIDYEEIEVMTINGMKRYKAIPCLLTLENKKESVYIYLAFIEEYKSFHGCEVLLNAYLM